MISNWFILLILDKDENLLEISWGENHEKYIEKNCIYYSDWTLSTWYR